MSFPFLTDRIFSFNLKYVGFFLMNNCIRHPLSQKKREQIPVRLRDLSSLEIDFILPVNYKICEIFTTDFHKLHHHQHHLGLSINKHQSKTVYMSTYGHHHVFIQPNSGVTYSIQNMHVCVNLKWYLEDFQDYYYLTI